MVSEQYYAVRKDKILKTRYYLLYYYLYTTYAKCSRFKKR